MVKLNYNISESHSHPGITTYDEDCLLAAIKDADSKREHSFISLAECLGIEKALESSILERKPIRPAACASVDPTHTGENSVDRFLVTESKVVKTDSYTDKAMTETERPKMIVCFEKEAYELVKDICVDNGVQSFDKISSPKVNVDDVKTDTVYHEGEWTDSNVVPGFDSLNTFLLNEQVISDAGNGVSKLQLLELENHRESEIVSEPASVLPDGRTNDQYGDMVPFSNIVSPADGLPGLHDRKASTLQFSDVVNRPDSSKQDSPNEANTQDLAACSDDEPGTSDNSTGVDKSRDVRINGMDSGNMKQNVKEGPNAENETEGILDPPQHGHSKDDGRETSEGLTAEARSSLVHYGFADESLFGQHSVSTNSISFSGQMAYNGNTSLRSDSSTTSTRSFAFPVLQTEWSSPVKMAKADRKYYRRHRWRNGFLCCRF